MVLQLINNIELTALLVRSIEVMDNMTYAYTVLRTIQIVTV
jgi:hypothetical protein